MAKALTKVSKAKAAEMAIDYLARVLNSRKATAARKDKAARLLLQQCAPKVSAKVSAGRRAPLKGKKEEQAEAASNAGTKTQWEGVL